MRFTSAVPDSKVYLFKDMPDIEHALTASDRVRLREERLRQQNRQNATLGEVAFQFLTPRLTAFGELTVFAVEAFMPFYHTETRMSYGYYGYYGGYPYSYTVFDGYDFFSEVLLAFDQEGQALMNLQSEKIAPIHGADYIEDEYFAQVAKWYDNRFLIFGSQVIQNGTQPKPRRTVYYLQKVQYD